MLVLRNSELYHHGIAGQKWGKTNGPPYPLDPSDHSASEKKAGWRKSLDKEQPKRYQRALNEAHKKEKQTVKKIKKIEKKHAKQVRITGNELMKALSTNNEFIEKRALYKSEKSSRKANEYKKELGELVVKAALYKETQMDVGRQATKAGYNVSQYQDQGYKKKLIPHGRYWNLAFSEKDKSKEQRAAERKYKDDYDNTPFPYSYDGRYKVRNK